jgi:integrase
MCQVGSLTLGDIEGAQADIAAGKTAKPRAGSRGGATTGGEGVAARTMSSLHAIFEHAVRLGKIESNPARGVRRLASTPRDRRLSRAEIAKLGKAMHAAETAGEHPTGLAAICLLALTGFRRLEGLGLRRDWLNTEEAAIRFPDTKSGAQLRVIGRPPWSCCSRSRRARSRPSSSRPAPMPSVRRPRLIRSTLAAILARCAGLR